MGSGCEELASESSSNLCVQNSSGREFRVKTKTRRHTHAYGVKLRDLE